MRHYEIVFLVHPDQTGQVEAMTARYRKIVKASGGDVHRFEDWGLRQLAYPINKINKAHYILMNVEATSDAVAEISRSFQFNDAVIRNLVVRRERAVTAPSPIARAAERAREESEARAKAGTRASAGARAGGAKKAPAEAASARNSATDARAAGNKKAPENTAAATSEAVAATGSGGASKKT